jgi:hypothetical protein
VRIADLNWRSTQIVLSLFYTNWAPCFHFSQGTSPSTNTEYVSATIKYGDFEATRQEPFLKPLQAFLYLLNELWNVFYTFTACTSRIFV